MTEHPEMSILTTEELNKLREQVAYQARDIARLKARLCTTGYASGGSAGAAATGFSSSAAGANGSASSEEATLRGRLSQSHKVIYEREEEIARLVRRIQDQGEDLSAKNRRLAAQETKARAVRADFEERMGSMLAQHNTDKEEELRLRDLCGQAATSRDRYAIQIGNLKGELAQALADRQAAIERAQKAENAPKPRVAGVNALNVEDAILLGLVEKIGPNGESQRTWRERAEMALRQRDAAQTLLNAADAKNVTIKSKVDHLDSTIVERDRQINWLQAELRARQSEVDLVAGTQKIAYDRWKAEQSEVVSLRTDLARAERLQEEANVRSMANAKLLDSIQVKASAGNVFRVTLPPGRWTISVGDDTSINIAKVVL